MKIKDNEGNTTETGRVPKGEIDEDAEAGKLMKDTKPENQVELRTKCGEINNKEWFLMIFNFAFSLKLNVCATPATHYISCVCV